jgi:thiamine kinase-like enzyme
MAIQATAATRLGALPIWTTTPSIAPISGGRTNENFRVAAGGRTYFARVGVDLPHHGISRSNEVLSHRMAAEAGVAPAVIHAADGVLVTEFVDGATLVQGEPVDDATLARLAATLRRLPLTETAPDLPAFDPVAICRRDLAALPSNTLSTERRKRAAAILDGAPKLSSHTLIHADLIPENVIVAGPRVILVDWEYAGRGDPAVDVASVILHFGLDQRQAALFVGSHGAVSLGTVQALQPVLALREALWCAVQAHFVGVRGDLADYTEMCWRRLDRTAP